ncbi:hypothetical protein [Desulfitobacterium sp.]|uniref:hypothetical protein n=1 Tax=Desulfitobacterium sp. TaxID=49981 RepID=UPI002CBD8DBE|nr:hypothetical protein [Desulfitobacterium sp.]HVJ47662.1 hypothetical protein [Desulfitobacterium sp.]
MLKQIGALFGGVVYFLFVLTLLNFIVKYVNSKYRTQLMKNEEVYNLFKKLMKFTVKNHKRFGLMTIVFLLLHFAVQQSQYGMNITGSIAAVIMLAQIGLGVYGWKAKKKGEMDIQ